MTTEEPVAPQDHDSFGRFALRVTVVHVATYMVCGLIASTLFDYEAWWATEWFAHYRPFDSPWVAGGPALQVVRGLVFATALYPFRSVFLRGGRGWLQLWALLVGLGIVSTFGATYGSIEGLIYTRPPLSVHAFGLPEVVLQAGAFSAALVGWYRHPHRAWSVVLGGLAGLAVLASTLGLLLGGSTDGG